jgi:hypothetical protein
MRMTPSDPNIGSIALGELVVRKSADGSFDIPEAHVEHLAAAGWGPPALPFEPDLGGGFHFTVGSGEPLTVEERTLVTTVLAKYKLWRTAHPDLTTEEMLERIGEIGEPDFTEGDQPLTSAKVSNHRAASDE